MNRLSDIKSHSFGQHILGRKIPITLLFLDCSSVGPIFRGKTEYNYFMRCVNFAHDNAVRGLYVWHGWNELVVAVSGSPQKCDRLWAANILKHNSFGRLFSHTLSKKKTSESRTTTAVSMSQKAIRRRSGRQGEEGRQGFPEREEGGWWWWWW